jgi:hypothetical protein
MLKTKLDDYFLAIGYMDKAQADAHMATNKLHYKDINSAATKAYRKQFDHGEWPPAKNVPDSKAPPAGYGANVAVTSTQEWCGTQAEVLAMIQQDKAVWKGTQAEVLTLIKQEGGGIKFGLLFDFSSVFWNSLLALWKQGVRVFAPLCWFLVLIGTLWLGLLPFEADPPRLNCHHSAQRHHNSVWLGPW